MLLFFTILIAICWILYELLIWTLSSYLIWDSVTQFSFVIGFFMTGMWIWAYISRFLEKNALLNFLKVELFLSMIWASSVIIMKLSYIFLGASDLSFQFVYFFITLLIWSFVGIEIPLVATIYKELKLKSKSIISDIFTFDYIWWLLASLTFPLILIPFLGLYNISVFIWTINLLVAFLYLTYLKKKKVKKIGFKKYYAIIALIFTYFLFLIFSSNKIENFYLKFYFKEPILQTYQTKYQQIVLTKRGEDFRMYLNWNIQFNSLDEHRYHKALVDWPLKNNLKWKSLNVLVLGWWDGLAVRNLLKYKNIENITLVELDSKMIEISKNQKDMKKLNKWSFLNKRVKIITEDAFSFIKNTKNKYDFIIADFPDPRDTYTAKLYSKEFYIWVFWTLKNNGIFVTQASNAFFSNKVMFSIKKTISSVFKNAKAYHRYLPSFWDWGFVVAKKWWKITDICSKDWCDYFDEDYKEWIQNIKENTLTHPVLIEYYGEWYKKYNL